MTNRLALSSAVLLAAVLAAPAAARDVEEPIKLAYLEGESRMALAERFDVPVSTIKTWLRRTLESVKTDCLLAQPREALLATA